MIDGEMQPFALTLDKFLEHAAKWYPHAEVVTARAGGHVDRIGYDQLDRRSRKVSAVLAGFDVQTGDRVATLAWNTQAHVEVWYAIMGMGAVCHTLNPRLTCAQLAAMVVQSEARVLVTAPTSSRWRARSPRLRRPSSACCSSTSRRLPSMRWRSTALEPLIERARRSALGRSTAAPCGLYFTSGTTGAPKGVTYTHRSSFLHTLRLLQVDGMAIAARDSVLVAVPMFHANAWGLPFAAPAVGAKLVLPGRQTDGASLAALINREAVTVAVGVATVWLDLVEHVESTGIDLTTLERIIVGGAPLPPALMKRIEHRLGVTIQTSWGMTERSPSGTVAPRDALLLRLIVGRPPWASTC